MAADFTWRFPAKQCHEGIPLGNGTFGALLWSAPDDPAVRLTINRADYWLHAGGWTWPDEATYTNLRHWLATDDEATLRRVFEGRDSATGARPDRPTRLPMGRVDLAFPTAAAVRSGSLNLATGEAMFEASGAGGTFKGRAVLLRGDPVLALRLEGSDIGTLHTRGVPPGAPDIVKHLHDHGFPTPARFGDHREGGWVQERPDEPALCVAWHTTGGASAGVTVPDVAEVYVVAVYGAAGQDAVDEARRLLASSSARGYEVLAGETAAWWRAWWYQAAQLDIPDTTADRLYRMGLYKLGGLSVPGSPAASLQGPWVEEHRLPPWSSDYHFNINVQECYWPTYAANHLETLEPLEQMLASWLPLLRDNARRYTGVEDGLLLPHAVDDRGTCMGGFWTGQTDHGSTAWAGQLLWLRYRHTLNRVYLRDVVYPFLRGVLRTYEVMLETSDAQGESLSLPVGVSPEFGGSGARAWGRNSSFQLACIHAVTRALLEASETLGYDGHDQRRWLDIAARLPLGSIGRVPRDIRGTELVASTQPAGDSEFLIWDDQPLTESHRHHSHLAALYPFGLLDPLGNEHDHALVMNSLRRLTLEGMGAWTGWCVPWAAILHARVGQGDMAASLLELFYRTFMGPGYYTTHDAVYRGLTVMANQPSIMQVEAALAASAAVLDMVAQTNAPGGGVLRVFSGTPSQWHDLAFQGIRADGAFLLDAERHDGETTSVCVRSEAGATLRLANPFGHHGVIVHTGSGMARYPDAVAMPVLTIETTPGEELTFQPA